jgi:prevent-host-death family protein
MIICISKCTLRMLLNRDFRNQGFEAKMINKVHIEAVTDFRNKTKEILEQVKVTPVILTQRSHPVAVVVDYDAYQTQSQLLEELKLKLDDLLLAQATNSSQELVSLEDMFDDHEKSTGKK